MVLKPNQENICGNKIALDQNNQRNKINKIWNEKTSNSLLQNMFGEKESEPKIQKNLKSRLNRTCQGLMKDSQRNNRPSFIEVSKTESVVQNFLGSTLPTSMFQKKKIFRALEIPRQNGIDFKPQNTMPIVSDILSVNNFRNRNTEFLNRSRNEKFPKEKGLKSNNFTEGQKHSHKADHTDLLNINYLRHGEGIYVARVEDRSRWEAEIGLEVKDMFDLVEVVLSETDIEVE